MTGSNQHSELVARVRLGLGGDFPFSGDSEALWKDATAALDRLVEQLETLRTAAQGVYDLHGQPFSEAWKELRLALESHPAKERPDAG